MDPSGFAIGQEFMRYAPNLSNRRS